jgi:hypothetical protein
MVVKWHSGERLCGNRRVRLQKLWNRTIRRYQHYSGESSARLLLDHPLCRNGIRRVTQAQASDIGIDAGNVCNSMMVFGSATKRRSILFEQASS